MTESLKPFFRYYGGKWRAAPKYPFPAHATIVEPFAGAAGYSCRYPDRRVVLVEVYPRLAAMWRYLTRVSAQEIMAIPEVESVDDLPSWVPDEGRDLVGFWLNAACVSPGRTLSAGRRKLAATGRKFEGWTPHTKKRIASQVERIRHWEIVEGDYTDAPDIEATWFIDPPYNNKAGSHYVHSDLDYSALGAWCRSRRGQVVVCENEGADWLPFRPFHEQKAAMGRTSSEVIWTNGDGASTTDRKGHSIRMSAEELATIEAAAGDMPWSTWLRELGLAMAAIEARGASVVVVEPRAEPDPWLGYHPDPALVARAKAEAEGPRPKPPKPPEPERRARRNAALFGFVED